MAAGSDSLNLILDDNSGAFQYGPFAWTSTQFSQYYGSEMMLPAFAVGITENSSNTSLTDHSPLPLKVRAINHVLLQS